MGLMGPTVPPAIRAFMVGNYSEGERVHVLCFVQSGDTPLTLSWLRNGRPLSDPEVEVRATDRYSSSLFIERVAVRHAGNYTCRAENAARASTYTARLRVNVPPQWTEKPKDVAGSLGTTVFMPCSAAGFPTPEIKWKKKDVGGFELPASAVSGVEMLPNGTLSIAEISSEHEGAYLCEASNGIGVGLSALARLDVFELPSFAKSSQQYRIREGQNQTITCDPSGDEPITLQWFRQDQLIESSERLKVRQWTSGRNASRSELQLLRAVPPDSGLFSCLARNRHGSARLSVTLEVEDIPLPPSDLRVTEVSSSRPLALRTDEEAPSRPPQALTAVALTSTQVKVSWRPPPADTHHGVLLGYRVLFRRVSAGGGSDPPSAETSLTSEERSSVHNVTSTSATLSGLTPHTWYRVTVQAYNGRGFSPRAAAARTRTLEDVPSAPPGRVSCTGAGPGLLRITWVPPPASDLNGRLTGYRVITEAVEEEDGELFYSSFDVADESCSVEGLRPNSNYSVRVAAATGVGAGTLSQPVFCSTLEDVPEEPAAVGVVVTSSSTALVSWLPPRRPNGVITSYNIYIRTVTFSDETSEERRTVAPPTGRLALQALSERSEYSVRVAARTAAGEGQRSRPVRFTTTQNVSAQIIPLSRPVAVVAGAELTLSCSHVGQPSPLLSWTWNGQPLSNSPRHSQSGDGDLAVTAVTARDAGNYTCHVSNAYGSDRVTYSVTVLDVPPPPVLRVTEASSHSVTVRWSSGDAAGLAIRRYRLQFWPAAETNSEPPAEVVLERLVREHRLGGLLCGTVYRLQLRAVNRLGASEPSRTAEVRTSGRPPVLTNAAHLLAANGSGITVRLHLWSDQGCPVTRFTVRWRPAHGSDSASVELAGNTHQYVIRRPMPPADYVINVTAVSPAGAASHTAVIRTAGGADVSAASGTADVRAPQPSVGLRVVVPVLAGLVSLAMVASAGYLCVRRRRSKVPLYLSEPPSYDGRSSEYSKAADAPLSLQSVPPDQLHASPGGGATDVCPYATFYPSVGPERTTLGGTGHYAALLPLGAAAGRRDQEGRYTDPHHLNTLPREVKRGRSLPASDEYDSLEELASDSASEPGPVRVSAARRGQHSLPRDVSRHAESSSSSCQLSPDLRARSFSAKRTKRKRRRARTPVLVPPSAEYLARVCPPPPPPPPPVSEADSRLLHQLKLQQELSQLRPGPPPTDCELELRALAHRLGGRQDFSINV
ncbi:Down syndrome cell adhesion molecule-like protein Dscam2 [Amphibalanus amphitrite]|uniref:Down syndrome cell adhesion molecule-like protein Dscam2 n=1 Tax=Amphibalanus amphitrite TaxID=1232801 RepID=A0A6A4V9N6_AMPAM|nr:Down syndrome cell adhesion molecule-like protein Dscam2 [Amphibalanus amphitrite]